MDPKNFYFSTPMPNPNCPFNLPNACVLVTSCLEWDKGPVFYEAPGLGRWMQKQGFGELMPNFYQADSPALPSAAAVQLLLDARGMTHNPTLDAQLPEFFTL